MFRYVFFFIHGIMRWCLHEQSCPPLCDPMDGSPPGSSVHGISQARRLEWVAISFSRGSSSPRDQTRDAHASSTGKYILYFWTTGEAHNAIHILNKLLYFLL